MIGCNGGDSCDQVLWSRWSSVGGVLPVSGLAAGAYLAMLVASLFIGPATEASVRRIAWRTMLVLAGAVAGSAVWFTIVQKWIVGTFCLYCMTTHLIGLLLTVLVVWKGPMQCNADSTAVVLTNPALKPDVTSAVPFREVTPSTARRGISTCLTIGLALAGLLAAGQVGFAPPARQQAGESPRKPPAMDPQSVPLVGSPNALYVVAVLFDYKCPHCQQMHFMLDEAIRRYGGKLAFALCPAPLNRQCNPYIPRNVEQFKDSCELAKIGLAVWVARREALPDFNRWMFSFESGDKWHPRSLDAARAKAVELLGQAKFDAAQTNSWIDRYLQTSTRIFGDTGGKALPKLVFGSRWVIPELHSVDDLVFILNDRLAVPKP